MREVKFRAWNKKKEYFITHDTMNIKLCDINNNNYKDLLIFQQYTGVKDVNNIEIYEGDIVERTTFDGPIRGHVFFEKGRYLIKSNECCWGLSLTHYYTKYKVLGNIYENPELLENK